MNIARIEQCGIKSFCRGLQRQQYEEVFLCRLDQVDANQYLNFTHRTAHGTHGEGDVVSNKELAEKLLNTLK